MDITAQVLTLAASWPGLLRFIVLLVVLGALLWALGFGLLKALRILTRGRKISTPIGAIEDTSGTIAPAAAAGSHGDCVDEDLGIQEVDEAALARPVPIDAPVLDRQLQEVDEAIKNTTAMICEGIIEEDHRDHVFKRQSVRVVLEGRRQAITQRLIYNGLARIRPTDVKGYCKERSEQLLTAVDRELTDMMITLDLSLLDLKKSIHDRGHQILETYETMFRTCIQIAKDAHKMEGCG